MLAQTESRWCDRLQEQLAQRFGDAFSTGIAVRSHHGVSECLHPELPPQGVLFARSTEDVVEAVAAAARTGTPIIPYGAGSSVEGQILATRGGLAIDLTQMNGILEINEDDLDCTVQAGVTRNQLNQHLRDMGLFFPVDPGADATIGGMAATRASGTNAVRYGTMRSNVLGLTVVLADGRVIRTGGRARKSSAGYDLTGLFVGSEGTLGIITEIRLRLYGIPEATAAAVCPFDTLEGAVTAASQAVQLGLPVARMELLDALQMRAVNQYSHTDYPEVPTLFLEFHGSAAGVEETSATFRELAAANSGGAFAWALAQEERSKLWDARHKAYFAALALAPGKKAVATDVCVPVSHLAHCISQARRIIDEAGLTGPILGHVGDGNFHAVLLVEPTDHKEVEKVRHVSARIVELALAAGGTCTGEHGIGLGKKDYLLQEHGEGVEVMKLIKRALDPAQIMNPDKIFDL